MYKHLEQFFKDNKNTKNNNKNTSVFYQYGV